MILRQKNLKIRSETSKSFIQFNILSVIFKSFVCNLYVIRMSIVCTLIPLVYHSYDAPMYLYVIRMSFLCVHKSSLCTCMPFVYHSYLLECHSYVTRMYSYVTRVSLACTRMSSVCHLYVLICHPYVTHMWFYHEPINVTITYIMPFFERLNWNSIFGCSDDLHVWYQMKAYMCWKHEKQSIHESKVCKYTKIICFCRPDVHF